jgi:hypothetical protein
LTDSDIAGNGVRTSLSSTLTLTCYHRLANSSDTSINYCLLVIVRSLQPTSTFMTYMALVPSLRHSLIRTTHSGDSCLSSDRTFPSGGVWAQSGPDRYSVCAWRATDCQLSVPPFNPYGAGLIKSNIQQKDIQGFCQNHSADNAVQCLH